MTPDEFVSNEHGVLILDAIAMRLQVTGELMKKVHKTAPAVLDNHPEINRRNIMKFRDIVSHHYDKIDHEIIFDICQNHLPELEKTIQIMIRSFPS